MSRAQHTVHSRVGVAVGFFLSLSLSNSLFRKSKHLFHPQMLFFKRLRFSFFMRRYFASVYELHQKIRNFSFSRASNVFPIHHFLSRHAVLREKKQHKICIFHILTHTHTHKDTDISSHTPITITRIYNEIKEIEIQQPNLLAYAMASILQWILLFSLLCVVCCIYLWESAKKQKKLCMDISRHCKHGIT